MRSNVARCGDAVPTQAPFWCLQWRPQRQVCLKPAGRLACVPLSCPCAGHLVSTHMQAHTQAGMFSQARARVHASSLARAHTHTRTLTRIHIQTRMHAGRQQAEDLGKVFRLVMYPRCVCASVFRLVMYPRCVCASCTRGVFARLLCTRGVFARHVPEVCLRVSSADPCCAPSTCATCGGRLHCIPVLLLSPFTPAYP